MDRRFTLSVLITLVILSLCASPAFASYNGELKTVLRTGRVFSTETFDANLICQAIFFSEEFRNAYGQRWAERNHFDDAEEEAFLREQHDRQSRGWEFFISFYTKKDYKKFTNDPDSFWKIRLVTDSGEEVAPTAIEMIPVSPYEKVMFKNLNRWSQAYRVVFPKVSLGENMALTIFSVIGQSTLNWKLKASHHSGS